MGERRKLRSFMWSGLKMGMLGMLDVNVSHVCTEFVSSAGPDRWSEKGQSGRWTRVHTTPRTQQFTPYGIENGPNRKTRFVSIRKTVGVTATGKHFEKYDNWQKAENAHADCDEPWTGITVFYINDTR